MTTTNIRAALEPLVKTDDGCSAAEWSDAVAAALCAAADQVVPAENAPALMRGPDLERLAQRQHTRAGFLAIATELEAQP